MPAQGQDDLKVMCLTNEAAISKGTLLMAASKPPVNLPEDIVMCAASQGGV